MEYEINQRIKQLEEKLIGLRGEHARLIANPTKETQNKRYEISNLCAEITNELISLQIALIDLDIAQDVPVVQEDIKKATGRPSIGDTKKVSVSMTQEEWQKLNEVSKHTTLNRSQIFRLSFQAFCEKHNVK